MSNRKAESCGEMVTSCPIHGVQYECPSCRAEAAGRVKSAKKALSSAINGAKGGRPKKDAKEVKS